jgi:hypothetical protein
MSAHHPAAHDIVDAARRGVGVAAPRRCGGGRRSCRTISIILRWRGRVQAYASSCALTTLVLGISMVCSFCWVASYVWQKRHGAPRHRLATPSPSPGWRMPPSGSTCNTEATMSLGRCPERLPRGPLHRRGRRVRDVRGYRMEEMGLVSAGTYSARLPVPRADANPSGRLFTLRRDRTMEVLWPLQHGRVPYAMETIPRDARRAGGGAPQKEQAW